MIKKEKKRRTRHIKIIQTREEYKRKEEGERMHKEDKEERKKENESENCFKK